MEGEDAKNWRKRLGLMRTALALKAERPDGRRLGEAVDRARTEALQAAAQNPDHSEAGRAAALNALKLREVALIPWRLTVPGFIDSKDLGRGLSLFFGWGRALRVAFALLAVAAGAAAITALIVARELAGDALLAFAILALGWGALSLFRPKPARLLVLRGDDVQDYESAFRAFVGAELCGFGHIWRLAAPEARRRGLREKVGGAGAYRRLALALRDLTGRNFSSAVGAARRARVVHATSKWRELTRRLLWDSADAVVVDLSGASEAEPWCGPIREDGVAHCVYVALWGQEAVARAALQQAGVEAQCHLYAPDGHMLDRAAFRAAMLAAMRGRHGPR